MAQAERSVAVLVKADIRDYVSKMGAASKVTKDFATETGRTVGSAAAATKQLGGAATQASADVTKAANATRGFGDSVGKASAGVAQVKQSTQEVGAAARQTSADFDRTAQATAGFGTRISAGFAQAKQATRDFGDEARSALREHQNTIGSIGTGMVVAGAALAAGIGLAVKAFADFDQQMSNVAAVSEATATEMTQLTDAALAAGAATKFSASQAAEAEAELTKAGVSVQDVLGGALTGALSLAAAGNLDLAKAAEISANAMNIFSLSGKDVGHIADVLAAGANKSAADVTELGTAMQQSGLVASQMGLDLEDTVGILSAFADNGLKGSDAGTSFKTMLQRLVPTSVEAASTMKDIGFSAYDAQGNLKSLDAIAQNLQDGLGGLTQKQRDNALATIFGSDAVRAANVLYKLGATGVRDYTKAVNDNGAAARVAARQMDNLAGDMENLRGSIETALIQGGSGANDALRGMAQNATEAVNAFGELPEGVQKGLVQVAALTSGVLLLGGGLVTVVPKILATKEAIDALTAASPRAAGALGALGKAGAVVGIAAAVTEVTNLTAAAKVAKVPVDQLANSLAELGNGGEAANFTALLQLSGPLAKQFDNSAEALQSFGDQARLALDPSIIEQFFGAVPFAQTQFEERVKQIDAALENLVKGGHADQAAAAVKRLQAAVTASGGNADAVTAQFTKYQAALDTATVANSAFSGASLDASRNGQKLVDSTDAVALSFADAQGPGKLLAGEIKDQEDAAKKAKDAYKELTDAVKDYGKATNDSLSATSKYESAIDDAAERSAHRTELINRIAKLRKEDAKGNADEIARLTKELEGYSKTLDLGTEAGRANVASLQEIAQAAKDSAVASLDAGDGFDQVKTKFIGARDEFIKRAIDFGASPQKAQEMADKLGLTATNLDTLNKKPPVDLKVNADTAPAQEALNKTNEQLDALGLRPPTAVKVGADTTQFDSALTGTNAQLDALGLRPPTAPRVDADTAAANANLGNLTQQLVEIGNADVTATVTVQYRQVGPTPEAIAAMASGAMGPVGFAGGGYTGDIDPRKVAGVVHGREFVFDEVTTAKAGPENLEALRKEIRGYRIGGYVAPGAPTKMELLQRSVRGYKDGGFVTPRFASSSVTSSATTNNNSGGNVTNDRRINIGQVVGADVSAIEREAERRRRLDRLGTRRAR